MLTIIAFYTNKRIQKINTDKIINEDYRKKVEKMIERAVTVVQLFAYIGLLILFGLSNRNEKAIELKWSEKSLVHHCPFATEAMSRERFQLISRLICFDDIDTRKNRENNKFHKMEVIFKLYKKNLNLIVPSYQLCIDENLYAFRGICRLRHYIPRKPARYALSIGVWLMLN